MATWILIIYLNSRIYHNEVIQINRGIPTEQACVNLMAAREKDLPVRVSWKYTLSCKRIE